MIMVVFRSGKGVTPAARHQGAANAFETQPAMRAARLIGPLAARVDEERRRDVVLSTLFNLSSSSDLRSEKSCTTSSSLDLARKIARKIARWILSAFATSRPMEMQGFMSATAPSRTSTITWKHRVRCTTDGVLRDSHANLRRKRRVRARTLLSDPFLAGPRLCYSWRHPRPCCSPMRSARWQGSPGWSGRRRKIPAGY